MSSGTSFLKLVYGYDPAGNIISIERDRQIRNYGYNRASELTSEECPGPVLPSPLPATVDKTLSPPAIPWP